MVTDIILKAKWIYVKHFAFQALWSSRPNVAFLIKAVAKTLKYMSDGKESQLNFGHCSIIKWECRLTFIENNGREH